MSFKLPGFLKLIVNGKTVKRDPFLMFNEHSGYSSEATCLLLSMCFDQQNTW